ncbi:MAG: hypothetical protein PWQ67_2256 [Clostridia bacterium]|jgi:uncharacterized protein YqhQ|nr:hypothetical protein [Clostridia bacterium]MDN5323802.1 hypothetical protein [Clostridia bacterium]
MNFQYGGQALIEGVMMRGKKNLAMAVRKSNNDITCKIEQIESIADKYPFLKWPFLRGSVALIEALVIGIKALTFSANESAESEEEELTKGEMFFTVALALGLGILLFFITPAILAHLLKKYVSDPLWQNLIEGIIRISIFILYVIGISVLKDIQRVFQYHGAEHKVIHTYEAGEELTVTNCQKYSTLHPRCGTSFLLIVMVISILVFSLLGVEVFWWRLISRVILLPFIAGISYEFLKYAGKHTDKPIIKVLNWPGMMLQKLTTREPDDSQIEVAIKALERVIEKDNNQCESV